MSHLKIRSKTFLPLLAGLSLLICAAAPARNYKDILVSPDRPDNEKAIDAVRKPDEVMAFYGVKAGDKVADLMASRGPFDKLALPQDGSLDFVLIHLDYHEIARETRPEMNRRVFAALKRGGVYGVVDHSAKEGEGDAVAKTLHRMDKNLVIKELTRAGFRLDKEGAMLQRPDDTRDFSVIKIRDKSDRFVLKFVKP